MSGIPIERLVDLLAASLDAWKIEGTVEQTADGGARLVCGASWKTAITIEPTPAGAMFRWLVGINGRKRGALSVSAVLRQIRQAIDPHYAAQRLRVAVVPAIPS